MTVMMTSSSDLLQKLITNLYLPCYHARKLKLYVPPDESVQVDGEDCTDTFSGKELMIEHRRRVRLLVLE